MNVDVYARMLLAVCEHRSRIGVLAMSARRSDLERRLTALLVKSPQRRSVTAAAIAMSVAAAASVTQLPAPIIRPPVAPLAEEIPADAPAELKEGLAAFDRGDYSIALARLRPLAEQGDATAERHLGQMYDRGLGVPQDYVKAVAWYRKSAAQGDINAQQGLADMYVQGHGVPHDRNAAALWQRRMVLQLFANSCDPKNTFQFKGDIENKTAEYRKAAEHGDGQAASDLGSWYEAGFYSGPEWRKWKPDHAAALKWLRMAAEYGDANGEAALASLYLRGSVTPPDAKAAVTWMRKAAMQGLPRAQCSLAVMYDEGIGTSQDRAEAAKWYRTVANTEPHVAIGQYPPDPYMLNFARTKLAILYERGDGVPRNDGEAITWFRRAIDHGYPLAETHLGLKYAEGHGVARDSAKALPLLSSAAWKGDTAAQIGLARLYVNGAPQDPVRAYIWLSIAARYPSSATERAQALKERDAIRLTRPQIEQANGVVATWLPVDDLGGGGHAGGHSRRPTYP